MTTFPNGFHPSANTRPNHATSAVSLKVSHKHKDAFRRRLEDVKRENLNPPTGLRASHEWIDDVLTIPDAERQNPGSDKTPSSSATQDFTQPAKLEGVMSLKTALARALQRLGAIW